MVRKMVLPAMLAIAVVGCSKDVEESDIACENSFVAYPLPNTPDAYYRTPIEATLAELDPAATITVEGVQGTQSFRGNTLVFTPAAPLAPSTTYNVTVTHCAESTYSFTTSAVGGTVDTADLAGKTYALDLASGRFVHPEGVGSLLQQYLTTDVLVGVVSSDNTSIQMVGAIGIEEASPPAQDTCNATIPFPQADFAANPFFEIGPETTTLNVEDFEITITDLMISGAFAPDATYLTGAVLSGSIDTRPLVPLLGDAEAGEDAICKLAESIGVACEPCPAGGNFCLSIYVDSIDAASTGTSLQVIASQEDACLREECATDSDCTPDTAD